MNHNEFEPEEANKYSLYILYKLREISSKFNLNKIKTEFQSTSLPNYNSTQSQKTNLSNNSSKTNNTYSYTNNEKEFLSIHINQLNTEQIKNQIDLIKKYNETKLKEIDNICQEINSRDEKINELSQSMCHSLKSVDTQGEVEEMNFKYKQSREISEIKIEINNLKRKHNKRVIDKQKECEEVLKKLLEKKRDEYNVLINKFGEETETNIYNLQDQIYKIKTELNTFDENNICNKDSEKENKNKKDLELLNLQEDIDKYEYLIKENLSTKNKHSSYKIEESNYLDFEEIKKELLLGENENSEVICVISQLDNPMLNFPTHKNQNSSINSKNKFHNNLSYNSIKNNESHIQNETNKSYNINNTLTIDGNDSISAEIKINKINNMNSKIQFFDVL